MMCDGGCYRIKTSAPLQYYDKTAEIPYAGVNKGLVDYTTSHGLPHIAIARGK